MKPVISAAKILFFLIFFTSFGSSAKNEDSQPEYTYHYFYVICIKDTDYKSSQCLRKDMGEFSPLSKSEFIQNFFGKNLKGLCSNESQKECVVVIRGPIRIKICLKNCPALPSESKTLVPAVYDDNFNNYCKRNPRHLLCAVLAPTAALPDSMVNISMTEQPVWGCAIILCLASSGLPTACKPPIKKLWKHLARGRAWPICKGDSGKVGFVRYWTDNWRRYSNERFPLISNLQNCKIQGLLNKIHYVSGKPDLRILKETQSKYPIGSPHYISTTRLIKQIESLPRYEFKKDFVNKFKIVTKYEKDGSCDFDGTSWDWNETSKVASINSEISKQRAEAEATENEGK